MKRIIFAILFLLTYASVFGQGSVNTTWRRAADTSISRTNNVRVPVYLKVGRRPDDPFPTYSKAFLAADSVASASTHYIPMSGWLSVPIPTSALQHAIAGEIYYTANSGTQTNNLVGQELSVNVPGRLVFNKASQQYGIYGLIVNGKPTTTNGHGYMEGRRFIGIYIDLADVTSGQIDSVRFDTTIGLWIPRFDGGRDDSGFAKLAIRTENTVYFGDTTIIGDAIKFVGDSTWILANTIHGIGVWQTDTLEVPIIDSRLSRGSTSMLRLINDSGQVRILAHDSYIDMQFSDSSYSAVCSLLVAGASNTPMALYSVRARNYRYRNLDGSDWHIPRVAPPCDSALLCIDRTANPDTTFWICRSALGVGGGGLDSTTASGYYVTNNGDTVSGTFDFSNGNLLDVSHLQVVIIDSLFEINGDNNGLWLFASGTGDIVLGYSLSQDLGLTGQIRFYQGSIERMQIILDSLDGNNRSWIVDYIGAKIDSAWHEFVHAATIHTTDIQGIDTTGPITAYSELDMNGYSIINSDSVEANRVSASTVRATTYENLPSTLATDAEVTTVANGVRDDIRDTTALVVHDSLRTYKYKKASYIDHWNHTLADNVWCYEHVKLGANTATPIHALIVDTAGDISAARADTVDAVFEFDAACTVDSVIFRAKTDNAANYITERNIVGPDDSTPDNDSLYQTWTTDWDYTSYSTESILLANPISVLPGETYKLRFIFYHGQDNSTQHVLWAKLGYR